MKKVLLLILLLTSINHFCYTQTPGNVSTNLKAWYKADAGVQKTGSVAATDNSSVLNWINQFGGTYNLTQATPAYQPIYFNTTSNQLINYNPSIRFDGNNDYIRNLTALMTFNSAYTFFIVALDSATDANYRAYFSAHNVVDYFSLYKNGINNTDNSIIPYGIIGTSTGGDRGTFGKGTSFGPSTGAYWNGSSFTRDAKVKKAQTQIIGMRSANSLATDTLITYTDGYRSAPIPFWTYINENPAYAGRIYHFAQLNIGADANTAAGYEFWRGNIAEVIAYDRNISETEASKIQSYLAIKYGITLGQGNGYINKNGNNFNYLASDGSITWSSTTNTGFGSDIFGIGRDDNTSLNQKQAKSINGGFQPAVSLNNGLSATNAANSNTFSVDKSYWIAGHNGKDLNYSTTYTPNSFSTTSIMYLLDRVWKVQETGTVNNVTITIPEISTATASETYLIVSNSSTFSSGNTEIKMTSDGFGNLYAQYDFSSGNYFTITIPLVAPGAVTENLKVWYKANDVILTGDGTAVSQWNNSFGASTYNLTQASTTNQPTFYSTTNNQLINYNPSLRFDGNNDFIGNESRFMAYDSSYAFFFVAIDSATDAGWKALLSAQADARDYFNIYKYGASASNYNTIIPYGIVGTPDYGSFGKGTAYSPYGGSYWNGSTFTRDATVNKAQAQILGMRTKNKTNTDTLITYTDGYRSSPNVFPLWSYINENPSYVYRPRHFGTLFLGADAYSFAVHGEHWRGNVAEVIAYDRNISDVEANKIQSYLGIKYGITLGQGNGFVNRNGNNFNYLASDGTITWNGTANSGYGYDIFGIGYDIAQDLNQKQSKSINGEFQPAVSLNDGLAANNAANINTFSVDKSYLVAGHNGSAITFTNSYTPITFSSAPCLYIMDRIWKVQESGTINNVTVTIPITNPSVANNTYMVINNSATFGAGTSEILMTNDGNGNLYAQYNFTSGDYFTFVQPITAPGGVTANLKAWYKGNDGILSSDGTAVSQWTNVAPSATYNVSQATASQRPIFYNTTANKLVNNNPSVEFDGGDELENANRLYANTDGFDLLAVGVQKATTGSASEIMGIGADGNYPAFGMNGYTTSGWYPWFSAGSSPVAYDYSDAILYNGFAGGNNQQAQIYSIASQNGGTDNVYTHVDGYEELTTLDANNQTQIGNGVFVGSSGAQEFTGLVNEIIIYNKKLSSLEKQKVNSYLAIKYGITLDQRQANDYIASNGSSIYAASTFGDYDHDIAGIGMDICSGLLQPKSTSVNEDAVVTMQANVANISNMEFLAWANNDLLLAPDEKIDIPSSGLPTYDCPGRVNRIWHVQKTGDVGNVTLSFNAKNIPIVKNTNVRLLVRNGSDIMSGATVVTITPTIIGDTIRFTNVSFSNNDYFTIIGEVLESPGLVAANLLAWYKADAGVTGSPVTLWEDQTVPSYDLVQSGTTAYRPATGRLMNFNPTLTFDTLNTYLTYQSTRFISTTSSGTLFGAANNNVDNGGYENLAVLGIDNPHMGILNNEMIMWMNGSSDIRVEHTNLITNGNNQVYGWSWNGGTDGGSQLRLDGTLNDFVGTDFTLVGSGGVSDGMFTIGAYQAVEVWNGDIAEVILYDRNLTEAEKQRVETYLAIRYGTTLSHNYLSGKGTIIWQTGSGYDNDIAGIGREDCQLLLQKQSKSTNTTSVITIYNGDQTAGLPTTNATNSSTFNTTESFMLWGNNAASTSYAVTYTPNSFTPSAPCFNHMNRIWNIQETGSIGIVTVKAPENAEYLLVHNSADFSTGTPTEIPLVDDGNGNLLATVNFTDGQYFTFGTTAKAPGGINNHLVAWYKANDASNVTTSGTRVTTWHDSYGNRDLTTFTNSGTPTRPIYQTSGTKLLNYNPSLEFDNDLGTYQLLSNTTRFFPNTSGFHIITVGKDLETNLATLRATVGMGNSGLAGNYPGLDLQTDGASPNGWNFVMDLSSPIYYYPGGGYPLLYNGNTGGTNQQSQIYSVGSENNVTTVSAANNIYSYIDGFKWLTDMDAYQQSSSIGNHLYVGSSYDAWWDGLIGEVLIYDGLLTDAEMLKVNTYLAIKYGITLNQDQLNDYTASDGSIIYAASTYGAYDHDIAGIGKDDCSGLNQTKSTSVNGDVVVTMEANTAIDNNLSFLVWANNNEDLDSDNIMEDNLFNGSLCTNYILDKDWKVQLTNFNNATEPVTLSFDRTKLSLTGDKFALLIDTTGNTNYEHAFIIQPNVVTGTTITFNNVTQFKNGAVFTLATDVTAFTPKLFTYGSEITTQTCRSGEWVYLKDPTDKTYYLGAIKDSNNLIDLSKITARIDVNSAFADLGEGDAVQAVRLMRRMLEIDCNDCIDTSIIKAPHFTVRMLFSAAERQAAKDGSGGFGETEYLDVLTPLAGTPILEHWFKVDGLISDILPVPAPGIHAAGEVWLLNTLTSRTISGINFVDFTPIDSFSVFGYAISKAQVDASPLPIELLNFNGINIDNNNLLYWTTATEINNEYFIVEHSTDGLYFTAIGTVTGAGNSSNNIDYQFTHYAPALGNNYYRLKQVDFDGSFTYSNIVLIKTNDNATQKIVVYPNPVAYELNIAFSNTFKENTTINIYNTLGQTIYTKIVDANASKLVKINVSNLSKATYFIVIDDKNNNKLYYKFIKE